MVGAPPKYNKGIPFSGWGEEKAILYFRNRKIPIGKALTDYYLILSEAEETPTDKKRKEYLNLKVEVENKTKLMEILKNDLEETEKQSQKEEKRKKQETETREQFIKTALRIFEKTYKTRKRTSGQKRGDSNQYIYIDRLQWAHLGKLNPLFKGKNNDIEKLLNSQDGTLDPEKCREFVLLVLEGDEYDS